MTFDRFHRVRRLADRARRFRKWIFGSLDPLAETRRVDETTASVAATWRDEIVFIVAAQTNSTDATFSKTEFERCCSYLDFAHL